MSKPKEINFFNRQYYRGMLWYENHFQNWSGEKAIGEGSITYSSTCLWPQVPRLIADNLPSAKLIYMVRHPIDRMESRWSQHVANGDRIPEFNMAVREWRPILEESLYWYQINQFRRYFADEQILILFYEDFRTNPNATLKRCFEFLGVNSTYQVPGAQKNINPRSKLPMDTKLWSNIRNTAFGLAARRVLPEEVKDIFRAFLRKKLDVTPIWDEVTLNWAIEVIERDARQFLKYCNQDESFWDFGAEMTKRKLELSQKPGLKTLTKTPFVRMSLLEYEMLNNEDRHDQVS